MDDTERIILLEPGSMVRSMANKSEMYDPKVGYTDELYTMRFNLRRYAKFIGTLVRLDIMPVRHGQVLVSNFSQREFDKIRDGEMY